MSVETNELLIGSAHALGISPRTRSHTGVLLYPTIMGVNEPMRRVAGELAERQMTVVIFDPYRGDSPKGSVKDIVAKSNALRDDDGVADLTQITNHMKSALGLKRIGGIGWCYGGRIGVLHAALDNRVEVFCAYNPTMLADPIEIEGHGIVVSKADQTGQTMDEMVLARQIKGPDQLVHPQKDFTQPKEYHALRDALLGRGDPTFYEYYPGTDHGFSFFPGAANERAQKLAWPRTLSLLEGLSG